MKKVVWVILVLVILALVYFSNYRAELLLAASSIEIRLEQYPTAHNLTILQGEYKTTRMYMENFGDEKLVFISFYYEKPSGIDIIHRPEYTTLEPGSRVPILLNFTVGEDVENKTYKINVWAQSTPIADKYSKSEKYPIYVTVLYNPSIIRPTTTTTTITTTTTTTLLEQKIKEILLRKENLAILIIVILIALMVIPYLTFKESPEDLSKSPKKIKT